MDTTIISDHTDARDALKPYVVLLLSGIPVQVLVQRQHAVTDIHADVNNWVMGAWCMSHMTRVDGTLCT
jgi:hypothetical protein